MRLLIVDDHPTNLRLLRAQLEAEGHEVVDATDGREALAVLAREACDGVISDALMPHMDGFSLCLEIRREPRWRELPFVIYTSTYNSPSDRTLAINAGADHYVNKPAPIAELIGAIERARKTDTPRPVPAAKAGELGVMKEYNAALIAKLEEKNAALEQANADLRASEGRYQVTLDRMLEGCQIIGHDWRYLYVNEAAARHGRHTPAELIGRPILECHPGFEHTEVYRVLERCMQGREGTRVESDLVYPDGTTASFELSVQAVPEGLFVLSLDVTERKVSARKQRDQLDELLRWQEVMLGREDRVQELKGEVNTLLAESGRSPRYGSGGTP